MSMCNHTKAGQRDREFFFRKNKGGEDFFSTKKRGAKTFFSGNFFPKPGLGTR